MDIIATLESEEIARLGKKIPAFVYRPAGRADAPRPVLIEIHGGPESQLRPTWRPTRAAMRGFSRR